MILPNSHSVIAGLEARDPDEDTWIKFTLAGPRWLGIRALVETVAIQTNVTCQVAEDKGILNTSCLFRLDGTSQNLTRALTSINRSIAAH
jgi:hypothetical protein